MGKNNYKDLVRELALTDFKLRYNNSILGYAWSLLNPLLYFAVLFTVFSIFLRFQVEHYALYLLLGIIVWGFFSEATISAMSSLVNKASLIKKIYFPRWIIVLSSNLTTTIGFILNLAVFLIFFFAAGILPGWTFLIIIPYVFFLLVIVAGTSLLLSALFIRFRDLAHIWQVFLQLGFWVTPIAYPLSLIPEKYQFFVLMNPLARIIFDLRNALIYKTGPSPESVIGVAVASAAIFIVGYTVFKRSSRRFAEWV